MTVITGDFRDIAGVRSSGTVTITSVVTRPAHRSSPQVVTKEKHVIRLENGRFTSPELDPGPVTVELSAGAEWITWEVGLPEDGVHDLVTLIDQQTQWDPPVVMAAQAARDEAVASATQARADATQVAADRAKVDKVVADGAAAVRAHVSAEADRAEAGMAGAQAALGVAETARDDAVVAQGKAEVARDRAMGAESEAGESSVSAAASLDGAVAARTTAERAASDAAGSATAAVSSASRANSDAERAEVARSGADASAVAAAQSEGVAATAAEDAAGVVRDELSGLVVEASGYASSAEVSAREAAQSAQDALSVVSDGVPDASVQIKGKLKLAGDLGGTADSPTVPGLAGKVSAGEMQAALSRKLSQSTTGSRLYGTASDGAQSLVEYSAAVGAGTVPYRKADGTVEVGVPTLSADATPKSYVDGAIAEAVGDVDLSEFEAKLDAKADKTYVDEVASTAAVAAVDARIQVVTSMPAAPVPGVFYATTGSTPL